MNGQLYILGMCFILSILVVLIVVKTFKWLLSFVRKKTLISERIKDEQEKIKNISKLSKDISSKMISELQKLKAENEQYLEEVKKQSELIDKTLKINSDLTSSIIYILRSMSDKIDIVYTLIESNGNINEKDKEKLLLILKKDTLLLDKYVERSNAEEERCYKNLLKTIERSKANDRERD